MTESWGAVAAGQDGVLTRAQAVACGVSPARFNRLIGRGQWQRPHHGVAVTYSGPISDRARTWGALLYAGRDAHVSHAGAAWLHGLLDGPPPAVHITVPAARRVVQPRGVRLHYSDRAITTMGSTPRTPVEATVLDIVVTADAPEEVVDIVLRACQRRRTTAKRLRAAADARSRMPWRDLLGGLVEDVEDGATTALERRWRRDVERAHGLPAGGAAGLRAHRAGGGFATWSTWLGGSWSSSMDRLRTHRSAAPTTVRVTAKSSPAGGPQSAMAGRLLAIPAGVPGTWQPCCAHGGGRGGLRRCGLGRPALAAAA